MAEVPSALCGVCADNTNLLLECIECTNCKGVYHLDCYSQRYTAIVNYEQWMCINCTYVSDEEECFNTCSKPVSELCVFPEESDNHWFINTNATDPDQNYFINVQWDSPYTTLESWQDKTEVFESNFTVMHINCNRMFYKLDEICNILKFLPVSVLCLTETFLLPDEEDSIRVPGYTFIHKSRKNAGGGGIGMLIKKPIKYLLTKTEGNSSTFEQLFVKIHLTDSTYLVGAIYRPPGQSLPEFNIDSSSLRIY